MLVLDTCFAVDVLNGGATRQAFFEELEKGEEVVVPDFFFAEVSNVLWKQIMFSNYEAGEAADRLKEAVGFVSRTVPARELLPEALDEAIMRNHPVYDLFYFVLARRNSATLCTLDHKLQAFCLHGGVSLVALADAEWEEAGR